MRKKHFARDLYKKYKDRMGAMIEDFSYLKNTKSGTLAHCSIFNVEMLYFVIFMVLVAYISVYVFGNYILAGWIFVGAIALVATVFRASWYIKDESLFIISPVLKSVRKIDGVKRCDIAVGSSNFTVSLELNTGKRLVIKDGILSNVYAIYDLFSLKKDANLN